MKKVSIITVNYNQPEATEALLHSISRVNSYTPVEIIVVDNGSRTNPIPVWQAAFSEVSFIRSDVNLGFAGGNNIGIKAASGDYLFFVNNDTEFTPGLIDELADTLDSNPNVGIVSPKIRYYDKPDTLQYAGFTKMNYYTARNACIGQFEKDNGQYDYDTGETGFAHGAAMMMRRDALEKAGWMPEVYFLYYEEMDWCERVRKAGYTIWVNTHAVIYHKESLSVGRKTALKEYFMNRNRLLFVRRNCPPIAQLAFWPYFIFIVATRNVFNYITHKEWKFIPLFFKAVYWNIKNDTNCSEPGFTINN
jgi:GT2 family glycosyltransferase